jgi:hypothetical protein
VRPLPIPIDMTSSVKGFVNILSTFSSWCFSLGDFGHRKRRSQSETTVDHADLRGLGTT